VDLAPRAGEPAFRATRGTHRRRRDAHARERQERAKADCPAKAWVTSDSLADCFACRRHLLVGMAAGNRSDRDPACPRLSDPSCELLRRVPMVRILHVALRSRGRPVELREERHV
jgi:hypothetical protein